MAREVDDMPKQTYGPRQWQSKCAPEGRSRGGERGGSGYATGVGLMNGARRNALDMDMAHGHEHACRSWHAQISASNR